MVENNRKKKVQKVQAWNGGGGAWSKEYEVQNLRPQSLYVLSGSSDVLKLHVFQL